jgi:phosphate-selective porin OprO/OprP
MLVLDASSGVLLGDLDIGQPSNFLILNQDPREDITVLLDTKQHIVFAVHKGQILTNNLVVARPSDSPTKTKARWFAYTPPPRSLPFSYRDSRKWNQWDTKHIFGTFYAALVIDRQYWLSQDETSEQQVGDLKAYEGGEIRGMRFGAIGALKFERPWIYTIFASTTAFDRGFDTRDDGSLVFYDWRLDIPLSSKMSLAVGKQKEPISMERLMTIAQMPQQERSTEGDAMLRARNVGAVLSGTAHDRRMTWAGGLFNDWFDGGKSFDESSSQLVGRTTWLPYVSDDDSNLFHLGLGVRHTNAKGALHYGTTPEFNQSPIFVDTDLIPANYAVTYNPEVSWRWGPVWLLSEAMFNKVSAPEFGNPLFNGFYFSGTFSLSGEMRPYNRRSGAFDQLPIAKPVTQGGWGAWEASMRWSNLDLNDERVEGGEIDVFSLGLNWWPVRVASLSGNYRNITLNRFGTRGKSNGLALRLLLVLD